MAEHKYESIKSINMALENAVLQLRHQVDVGRSRQSRRRLIQAAADGATNALASSATSSSIMLATSPSSPPSISSISGETTNSII